MNAPMKMFVTEPSCPHTTTLSSDSHVPEIAMPMNSASNGEKMKKMLS